jgi:hypothetical protein
LWSGPDKVVQTGEKWYFQNYQKTSSCWFRPLFLVQTGKTWPIPSFFRLLRHIMCTVPVGESVGGVRVRRRAIPAIQNTHEDGAAGHTARARAGWGPGRPDRRAGRVQPPPLWTRGGALPAPVIHANSATAVLQYTSPFGSPPCTWPCSDCGARAPLRNSPCAAGRGCPRRHLSSSRIAP